jgi:hypothetical protein
VRFESDSDDKGRGADGQSFEVDQTVLTVVLGVSFGDFSLSTLRTATMPGDLHGSSDIVGVLQQTDGDRDHLAGIMYSPGYKPNSADLEGK